MYLSLVRPAGPIGSVDVRPFFYIIANDGRAVLMDAFENRGEFLFCEKFVQCQ